MAKTNAADIVTPVPVKLRKGMTVALGRGTFRVLGAERQGDTFLARLTRLTGRGPATVCAMIDDLHAVNGASVVIA